MKGHSRLFPTVVLHLEASTAQQLLLLCHQEPATVDKHVATPSGQATWFPLLTKQ
jgi:hypothetical protein